MHGISLIFLELDCRPCNLQPKGKVIGIFLLCCGHSTMRLRSKKLLKSWISYITKSFLKYLIKTKETFLILICRHIYLDACLISPDLVHFAMPNLKYPNESKSLSRIDPKDVSEPDLLRFFVHVSPFGYLFGSQYVPLGIVKWKLFSTFTDYL